MMNNVVIAIYLTKLFAAVFAVMGVGCVVEQWSAGRKLLRRLGA